MPTATHAPWGNTPDGPVVRHTLTNDRGNSVHVLNYGATVQSIQIDEEEMVLGYTSIDGYLGKYPYYGALVGRYGNRIAGARFPLDGTTYQLDANENGNQLHGGSVGFNRKLWTVESSTTDDEAAILTLTYTSPDGEMGYPGTLAVTCTYRWTNDNALHIHYTATTTDRDTIVNLTNHSYFSIGGGGGSVLDQVLYLDADRYTPVDREQIPTGQNEPVGGTPFDFRTPKPVGRDIAADHPQIQLARGYDHNFVINGYDGSLREFALLTDPASGRKLRCWTTEPGVQLFTTNFRPGEFTVGDGAPIAPHTGICLETQHFPDSPNQPNFATPALKVGDTYNTTTVYRFE